MIRPPPLSDLNSFPAILRAIAGFGNDDQLFSLDIYIKAQFALNFPKYSFHFCILLLHITYYIPGSLNSFRYEDNFRIPGNIGVVIFAHFSRDALVMRKA
jgi:hypothetical protein